MNRVMRAVAAIALTAVAACTTTPRGTKVEVPGGFYRSVSVDELASMLKHKDFFLVNVHVPYAGEIPKTDAFISYQDTQKRLGEYPPEKRARIVVYCMTNHMSGIAARVLVQAGYTDVYLVDGGMTAWQKANYELDRKAAP